MSQGSFINVPLSNVSKKVISLTNFKVAALPPLYAERKHSILIGQNDQSECFFSEGCVVVMLS